MVRQNYSKALASVAGARVVAVCDNDNKAAEAASARFGVPALSFQDLLKQVDIAVIATPPSTHFGLARECLRNGVMVFCEKPFVPTLDEARELAMLSSQTGLSVTVGHMRRVFPSVQLAKQVLASGVLGPVQRIDLSEGGRFSWETSSNYVATDVTGGVLFDTGSHTLDTAFYVCGLDELAPEISILHVARDRSEPSHEFEARFVLTAESLKVNVSLRLSRFRVLSNRARISCANGTIDIPLGPRDRVRITGPGGSAVVRGAKAGADYTEYFVRQFESVLRRDPAPEFRASRFLLVTDVIEQLSATPENA